MTRHRESRSAESRRHPARLAILLVAMAAFGALMSGCQFLQNEFYYLDRARPEAQTILEPHRPW
jgi:hypothetical protein